MRNNKNDISVKLLDDATIDMQVLLYQSAFNHICDFEIERKNWMLKHYGNPIRNSFIFGAFIEDKLVGMNA
mgnify:CR=1 FL=1